MTKLTVPNNYLVHGLEAIHYSKPDDKCEAVGYKTLNGTKFTLAKDFMGIQICKNGCFWPAQFTAFSSMEQAVKLLRKATSSAAAFFDMVGTKMEKSKANKKS